MRLCFAEYFRRVGLGHQTEIDMHHFLTRNGTMMPSFLCLKMNQIPCTRKVEANRGPTIEESLPQNCKRERSSLEPLISFFETKKAKPIDDNDDTTIYTCDEENKCGNGSQDSTTTSSLPKATLLEFPLLDDSIEGKENASSTCTFDAWNLEKSVPPGYLKLIGDLEKEFLNLSMERETLKIEVMRAQAMINVLHSRLDLFTRDNRALRESPNLTT